MILSLSVKLNPNTIDIFINTGLTETTLVYTHYLDENTETYTTRYLTLSEKTRKSVRDFIAKERTQYLEQQVA